MVLSEQLLEESISVSDKATMVVDLVYVDDRHLTIRRKKWGRGFTYLTENHKKISDQKQLKRIKSLVIPPGWEKVRICNLTNGHLQATGRDNKGRKVYLYHHLWQDLRNTAKYFKMRAFGKALPSIRERISQDLQLNGMPKEKCLALALSVMDSTYVRIGNYQYAKRNKTYGLTTMRRRHLKETSEGLLFSFKGKRGVQQEKLLTDDELIEHIKECEEIPGWELFKYIDLEGAHHSIDSGMVNEYLHRISKDYYSAKDFRTWGACCEFFEALAKAAPPKNDTEIQENILTAYDAAASALGNTRAVCKKYYVHPQIAKTYRKGEFGSYYDKYKDSEDKQYFSSHEQCLLDIISDYYPDFEKRKT